MGLLAGSASFVEFQVMDVLPATGQLEFIRERVRAFSFKDIDDTFDEFSIGWVSVLDMFDAGFSCGSDICGDFVTLSLRIDERQVSSSILKKYVTKEEIRVKTEQQIPRLSRHAKVAIKERIRSEFLRKAKPTPLVIDLFWDLSGKRLFFFSTNKKALAVIEDFFKETFGMMLRQNVPYLVAESFFDFKAEKLVLEVITESSFI